MADEFRPRWMYRRRPGGPGISANTGSKWTTSLDPEFHDERAAIVYGKPHPIAAGQPINPGDVEHPGVDLLAAVPTVATWVAWPWSPWTALRFTTAEGANHAPAATPWSPAGMDLLDLVQLDALLGVARRRVRTEIARRKAGGDA